MDSHRPTTLGDRIGDVVQWAVGGFVVLGMIVGSLKLLGLAWTLTPGFVLLGVLFWVVLLVGVREVVRTRSS